MAVDLTKAKAYRFGKKDLITLVNSFEMAMGNAQCVMGFDKHSYPLSVPVTVMDRSIYEFCTTVCSISLIMLKSPSEKKYSKIFYEVTRGVIQKANFNNFNIEVLGKIDGALLTVSPSVIHCN